MTATALDLDRIAALRAEGFALRAGHHDASDGEGCAMDLIAWQTTGEITDMPSCVHPILSRLVHRINDAMHMTVDDRWRIVTDAGPLLVGTDKWEALRAAWVVANAGRTVGGLIDALRVGADLTGGYLTGANLTGVYLAGANLTRVNLVGANLTRANLAGAYLIGANLAGANLIGADLAGASLIGADLAGASLTGAKGNQWTMLPDGWTVADSGLVVRSDP